jgi:cytidylate kinase
MKYLALAIDGPAGAGKSSVAKMLAKKLNFTYVDTGAMYRAATLKALALRIDLDNPNAFGFLDDTQMEFRHEVLFLDGKDVTKAIRSNAVSNNVSVVASHIPVRNKLVALQQQIANQSHVVMDGRDIGTVVLPQADLKIFLTASVEVRAARRHMENLSLGIDSNLDRLKKEIERRDKIDSERSYNPLRCAEDAIFLDTSAMDMDAVTEMIYNLFMKKIDNKRSN